MRYRNLGNTDIVVSEVGFGTGPTAGLLVRGASDYERVVHAALDSGITHFDTSPLYGDGSAEENLGKALRTATSESVPVISTKIDVKQVDPSAIGTHVRDSVERSRRRLGLDVLDVVLFQRRVGPQAIPRFGVLSPQDLVGPLGDAMQAEVDAGHVKAIGFSALGRTPSVVEVIKSGRFQMIQTYYNIINPSAFLEVPAVWRGQDYGGIGSTANDLGVGVVALRVLAGGALSGKSERHANFAKSYSPLSAAEIEVDRLRAQAISSCLASGMSIPELALRFALSQDGLASALVGISDLEQLSDVLAAVDAGPLPAETQTAIDEMYTQLYETL